MPLLQTSKFSSTWFWSSRFASLLAVAGLLAAFHFLAVPHLGIYDIRLIVVSMLFASLAVGLNLINGITGQFSIGHAAFYLIGAIVTAKLSVEFYKGQPMLDSMWLGLMVVAGGVAAGIAGLLVGLPSLRLRGDYLAIVTLGFGEIIRVLVINQDGNPKTSLGGLNLGGAYGLGSVPKLTQIIYIALMLIFTIAVCRNLLKTSHGLKFLAVREDELAAEATGVNTTLVKVTAFVIGAALAGMAGALFAHYNGSVSPDDFRMDTSFIIVAMVVIGGTGSITGAAIAGIMLKLLEEALRELQPVPALSLIAFIIALISILTIRRLVAPRGPIIVKGLPAGFLYIFGIAGCIGVCYLGLLLWKSDFSIVLKVAGTLLVAGGLIGVLVPAERSRALAKLGGLALTLAVIVLLSKPIAMGLGAIGSVQSVLGSTNYTPGDLRWAFFAISLVIVMLVRPQGILGHHEFSWDFFKALFGLPHKDKAVAV
ncbi:MAG: branched-chain amino acid ABC transporter permease [Fimbriimonadales bacterium]